MRVKYYFIDFTKMRKRERESTDYIMEPKKTKNERLESSKHNTCYIHARAHGPERSGRTVTK